jgi:hypothetical protein
MGIASHDIFNAYPCVINLQGNTTFTSGLASAGANGLIGFDTVETTFTGATPSKAFTCSTGGGILGSSIIPPAGSGTVTAPGWAA